MGGKSINSYGRWDEPPYDEKEGVEERPELLCHKREVWGKGLDEIERKRKGL